MTPIRWVISLQTFIFFSNLTNIQPFQATFFRYLLSQGGFPDAWSTYVTNINTIYLLFQLNLTPETETRPGNLGPSEAVTDRQSLPKVKSPFHIPNQTRLRKMCTSTQLKPYAHMSLHHGLSISLLNIYSSKSSGSVNCNIWIVNCNIRLEKVAFNK